MAAGGALALGLTSCGNSRVAPPDLSQPAFPSGTHTLRYSGSGSLLGATRSWSLSLSAPGNWAVITKQPPLMSVITSGTAVVAVWRYRRLAPVPAGAQAFARARRELIAAARARDPRLMVIRSRVLRVGSAPAVELDALERIDGQLRRARSTHVFVPGDELVLDQYAPPSLFHVVDHAVFSPMKRSLRLALAAGR